MYELFKYKKQNEKNFFPSRDAETNKSQPHHLIIFYHKEHKGGAGTKAHIKPSCLCAKTNQKRLPESSLWCLKSPPRWKRGGALGGLFFHHLPCYHVGAGLYAYEIDAGGEI